MRVNPTCNACKCEMQPVFSCRILFAGFQLCRTGNRLDLWTLCLIINDQRQHKNGVRVGVSGCKVIVGLIMVTQ